MTKIKTSTVAALMCMLWLAVYIAILLYLPQWSPFAVIVSCTLPMLLFKQKHRGKTFGASNCNTVKYKKSEYVSFFIFTIAGSALISALTYIVYNAFGGEAVEGAQKGFFYMVVFSCFLPAFFEEWLVRGGVLGALSEYGKICVFVTALIFALMHGVGRFPYSFFAGLFITALVYVTECIYLGMLLHFLNNFTSVILSYLSGGREYIALGVIMLAFAISFVLLRKTKLFADVKAVLFPKENIKEIVTPALIFFTVCALIIL